MLKIAYKNLDTIREEMIADYENRSGKKVYAGQLEAYIIDTFAYREYLTRVKMDSMYENQYPQYARGAMLDLHGGEFCKRLQPKFAQCKLEFTATDITADLYIAKNTRVSNSKLIFSTTQTIKLSQAEPVQIVTGVCETSGEIGNKIPIGKLNQIIDEIPNVMVKNITTTNSGADLEDDDNYRKRVLLAPTAITNASGEDEYEYLTRQFSQQIIDVFVDNPRDAKGYKRAGEVEVYFITKEGIANDDLIEKVQTFLENKSVRALNDKIIVSKPHIIEYKIEANIIPKFGGDPIKILNTCKADIAKFTQVKQNKLGSDIVQLDIASILKNNQVYDVEIIKPASIRVRKNAIAICKNISLTIKDAMED